jgi:cytoskeleton protein RodZ
LKYGARQIEALEAEEFSRLPGTTFVRGMIRGYAKLLEIDPDALLKSLERRHIPGPITADLRAKRVPFPDGTKRRGTSIYAVLSTIVLAAVLVVLYEWHAGSLSSLTGLGKKAQLAEAPESPESAAEAPATLTPVAAERPASAAVPVPATDVKRLKGQARIFLEFADEAWVEIKDSDGNTLMAQLNPGGSHRLISGQPPFSLVIGNAAAVRVVYNDAPVDLTRYVKVEVARLTLQ